jgi:hypothetical protein
MTDPQQLRHFVTINAFNDTRKAVDSSLCRPTIIHSLLIALLVSKVALKNHVFQVLQSLLFSQTQKSSFRLYKHSVIDYTYMRRLGSSDLLVTCLSTYVLEDITLSGVQ